MLPRHLASKIWFDLRHYSLDTFKDDLLAGLVTGIVAIPLSLALAIATGVPPVWGLYTAAVAGLVAAFFSGSRFSVSGPAAAMVPILAPIITLYGIDNLPIIGLIAGLMLIFLGIVGFGSMIKYVPAAVTYGFTAGIAVVLFCGQLNSFLGLHGIVAEERFHLKVLETLKHLHTIDPPTLIIGLVALVILLGLPYLRGFSKVPPSLAAVIVCTVIAILFPYFHGVATIETAFGQIALGFPPITIPHVSGDLLRLVVPAFKIAFLISIESLLCAVVADKMTRTRHRPNQELVAQGIANLFTPFFSGIPATAVIARTGTNIKNGAKTRISSVIHALFVLLFLLVIAPLGSKIPLTVLAAVLFITAWKISEYHAIKKLTSLAPRTDLVVLYGTFFLTVFWDLTIAVGVGLFLAALLVFRKLSTIYAEDITPETIYVSEYVRGVLKKRHDIQLVNLEGNLSMGFGDSLLTFFQIHEDTKHLILRFREVHMIDLSGLESLEDLIRTAHTRGIKVYMTSFNKRVMPYIHRYRLDKEVAGIYTGVTEAVEMLDKK